MVPFGRLLDALSEVPDPRRAEGKRYPLAPLLLFTVLALLSGATSYRHIICFLEQPRRFEFSRRTHLERVLYFNHIPGSPENPKILR